MGIAALGVSRSGFFNGVVLAYVKEAMETPYATVLEEGKRQRRLIRTNRLLCWKL